MMPLGKVRTIALLAVASAGLLGGHSLTYLWLSPSAGSRAAVLAASGHGYLEKGTVLAAALAVMAGLFWLADGAFKSRAFRPAAGHLVGVLGLVQVLGFSAQEVLERFLAAAPMNDLAPVLLVGIPLQLLVAAVGALLVAALHRAGARIAELIARPAARRNAESSTFPSSVPFRSAVPAGGLRSRGPPLLSN